MKQTYHKELKVNQLEFAYSLSHEGVHTCQVGNCEKNTDKCMMVEKEWISSDVNNIKDDWMNLSAI